MNRKFGDSFGALLLITVIGVSTIQSVVAQNVWYPSAFRSAPDVPASILTEDLQGALLDFVTDEFKVVRQRFYFIPGGAPWSDVLDFYDKSLSEQSYLKVEADGLTKGRYYFQVYQQEDTGETIVIAMHEKVHLRDGLVAIAFIERMGSQ